MSTLRSSKPWICVAGLFLVFSVFIILWHAEVFLGPAAEAAGTLVGWMIVALFLVQVGLTIKMKRTFGQKLFLIVVIFLEASFILWMADRFLRGLLSAF